MGTINGTGARLCGPGLLYVALCSLAAPVAAVQEEAPGAARDGGPQAPTMAAVRLQDGEAIDLDGLLDEPAWRRAIPATEFRQTDPVEAAEPSQATEVRVLLDGDNLFIGAVLHDDPAGILAYQKRRDQSLRTDDRFMFILDTFLDGRTGYFFETNPAGLMGDGLITGGGGGGGGPGGGGGGGGGFGVNKSWDGIWDVRTSRNDGGWVVEVRIPFRTMNFDPQLNEWGINFQRTIRRYNEEIQWSGHRRNQPMFQPIHAGRVTGLEGMSQGLGLEVKPYVLASAKEVSEELESTTYPTEIGGDLQYNITSGLRAALSINTDFAEVEVDRRQVNLTRFPLFFPEQRDFFLEGSSVYNFAPRSGPRPYFSRRIGLEENEPIPIRYGLRLGGQAGRYEMGFQHINTASHAVVAAEHFTVARVRRNFWEQSSLGVLYTRRATGADSLGASPLDRHTVGADANLATSTLFGDKNLQFEAFVAYNTDPDVGGEKTFSQLSARGFRVNYPNDIWTAHLSYREFGSAYDPAVGFVSRRDLRRVEPRIGWNPRAESLAWLRRFQFDVQYRYLAGLETGLKEEEQWNFGLLGLSFESGDNVSFDVTRTFELLEEEFEISDGIFIDPGEYTVWQASARAFTASRRPVSLRAELKAGGFWNGDLTGAELGLTFRPTPGISITTAYDVNDVRLPQGDFQTNLVRLEGGWDVNPLLSFNGNVQYDDVSDIVGLFGKVRWILQPGNDIFFVYTHNWRRDLDEFGQDLTSTISRGGTIKVNYTWRF